MGIRSLIKSILSHCLWLNLKLNLNLKLYPCLSFANNRFRMKPGLLCQAWDNHRINKLTYREY